MMLEFNIKTSREWNHHKTLHGADEAAFGTGADPPNQKTDRARNSGFPKSKQNRKNENHNAHDDRFLLQQHQPQLTFQATA